MMRVTLFAVGVLVACKGNEPSKSQSAARAPVVPVTEAPVGFWRIDTIEVDGAPKNLEAMMKASVTGEGVSLPYTRMTVQLEPGKLTVGSDFVFDLGGTLSPCSVSVGADIKVEGGKFTIPHLEKQQGSGGFAKTCRVSLAAGEYTIEKRGANLALHTTTDGKPSTMNLVPDEPTVDLMAKGAAASK